MIFFTRLFIWLLRNNKVFRNKLILVAVFKFTKINELLFQNVLLKTNVDLTQTIPLFKIENKEANRLKQVHEVALIFPYMFPNGSSYPRKYDSQSKSKMDYGNWCKINLYHKSLRFLRNPNFLFYMVTEIEDCKVSSEHNVRLKRSEIKKNNGAILKAKNIIEKPEGSASFRYNRNCTVPITRTYRLSAEHKKNQYLDLTAVCNQKEKPTMFLSFSCAETKWEDFSKIRMLFGSNNKKLDMKHCGPLLARHFHQRYAYIIKKSLF